MGRLPVWGLTPRRAWSRCMGPTGRPAAWPRKGNGEMASLTLEWNP